MHAHTKITCTPANAMLLSRWHAAYGNRCCVAEVSFCDEEVSLCDEEVSFCDDEVESERGGRRRLGRMVGLLVVCSKACHH